MNRFSRVVKGASSILDKLAGICLFVVMLLIVVNIVLRAILSQPILGTYEIVGFLTALVIAFALAYCAFQNGHIAIGLIVERFPQKMQSITEIFVNGTAFLFWAGAIYYLAKFAHAMKIKGLVSPSAEIPVYPFIYLVAICLLGLCLVLLYKVLVSFREVFESKLSIGLQSSDRIKR